MLTEESALEADEAFFSALLAGDTSKLDRLLTDDFLIIDVFSGSVAAKTEMITALDSGLLSFEKIHPAERKIRLYESTAIVTGRTEMIGKFMGTAFSVKSRYTHVFTEQNSFVRLASAQGTPIASE